MSPRHSPDDRPTTVQQQTGVQPAVTTMPATRRSRLWPGGKLPARIGRARTSTLVLGSLFLLLFALYVAVRPDPVEYTTVTTTTGQTLRVPASDVLPPPTSPVPAPESTPAETADPEAPTSDPADTTDADPTAPATTGRQTSTSAPPTDDEEEPTTSAPTTSRAPATTSQAPAPTDDAPAEPTG
ncbi:hypothetical protein [Modestobacter marinus]|uniref:hypothetical protein n=1 Tax=Modestobacter marinus TaxID=477641 RepID=UPI001C946FFF|nr:hypothetical protein [Modestobacter marinus]